MIATIKKSVIDLIQEKYQIVDVIDLVDYSPDAESLAQVMEKFYDKEFGPTERLVILHHDTDYYPSPTTVGNTVFNLFRLCANYLISLDHIIFLTNHYGIKDEIFSICKSICNTQSMPNVIYTSQWYDFPNASDMVVTNSKFTDPQHLFCCLNNKRRQHRVLTLCMLQDHDLLDHGLVSYHFKK
jgi:hypothetical protein